MKRRTLIKGAVAGAAATLAAPAVARAQQRFNWKMTNAYGPGAPFYVAGPGSPTDFIEKVKILSGGRLNIQHFAAGELIPALEGFDAVSKGTIEMNAANSYFWSGKTFAAQYFTAVPFGLNFQGMTAWLYHGGGLKLWEEVYAPFNLVPIPMGSTGIQMTGWFRKPIEKVEDLKGLKMRIPGLAGKVYAALGVDVKLLPAGEIFPALERGVIDVAEFVGPYQDRRLGLHKAAHHRLARNLDHHRADRQPQGVGFAAQRPQGSGSHRRRPGPCREPHLVRGDQRRGARRSGQESRRHRPAPARRHGRQAARSHQPGSRRRHQGPAGQEGP